MEHLWFLEGKEYFPPSLQELVLFYIWSTILYKHIMFPIAVFLKFDQTGCNKPHSVWACEWADCCC